MTNIDTPREEWDRTLDEARERNADTCVICKRADLPVSSAGHDWRGGRAHGVCIIEEGRQVRRA